MSVELCWCADRSATPKAIYRCTTCKESFCRHCIQRCREKGHKTYKRRCGPWKEEYGRAFRERHVEEEKVRSRRKWSKYGYTRKNRNPLKDKVTHILYRAVRDGKIIRPKTCSKCGREGLIHGHHTDYSKPLVVIWLCSTCHGMAHRKESSNGR